MLDLKLLEEIIPDIDGWKYADLKNIKLLSEAEIKGFAANDLGNLCDSDKLSLFATAIYYMRNKNALQLRKEDIFPNREVKREPYVSSGTPLPVKFNETTGIDKCVPVTCEN